ncbi:hypothetical protein Emed_004079 [Eimeria media]
MHAAPMSAFSAFCVPEVEGYSPVRLGDGGSRPISSIAQVGLLDFSVDIPGVKATRQPCLQHLVANSDCTSVCCIDADSNLALIDVHAFKFASTIAGAHSAPVTSCSFLHQNTHVLVTSSQDGSIKLWDLRSQTRDHAGMAEAQATMQVAPTGSREAEMWGLAVRSDDKVIAASFKNAIKGFDTRALCSAAAPSPGRGQPRRNKRLLWDLQVHGDVVAALRFHPVHPTLLVSGGEDSLVCVTDTTTAVSDSEDNEVSPVACFSQERAVKGLSLVGPGASCVCIRSAMEDVGLWQVEGLARDRGDRNNNNVVVQRKAEWLSVRSHPSIREGDSCGYVVEVFYDEVTGRLFILAGSVSGNLLLLHANLDGVSPAAEFKRDTSHMGLVQGSGHNGVVRGAISIPVVGGGGSAILTCGEDGRVCAWRQRDSNNERHTNGSGRRQHAASARPY